MNLKCAIFSCFASILLANSIDAAASIEQCANRNKNMKLLCRFDIDESFSWLGYTTKRLYCPSTGLNRYPITCIQVIDVSKENAGRAVIETGGIGYNFVNIFLTSKFFGGLKYHIEVYTVPSTSTTPRPDVDK